MSKNKLIDALIVEKILANMKRIEEINERLEEIQKEEDKNEVPGDK